MTTQTESLYELMARKPYSMQDLKRQTPRPIRMEEVQAMIGKEPVRRVTCKSWTALSRKNLSKSQWWIVKLTREAITLVIDTQGYKYPRYAAILKLP